MYRSHNAAEVNDFDADRLRRAKRAKRLDRFGTFSVACASRRSRTRGSTSAREDRERIGAMMGSALGGVRFAEEQLARLPHRRDCARWSPALALGVFGGAASCNIAIELGAQGPNSTNAMSCASGTIAIGDAFRTIRDGYADVMFAGGAEAPLAPLCFGAFALIRAMSTRNDDPAGASRPFDRDRDGFVMGEGAAVLVLEECERAVARGAHIYAEVVGYGMTQRRAPHDGAAARRLAGGALDAARAARRGRRAARDRRTSTRTAARRRSTIPPRRSPMKATFGEHAPRLPVSGTKGYYGHALGASGAIELAITALALEQEWLPPTLNLDSPDPTLRSGLHPQGRPRRRRRVRAEQQLRLRRHQRGGRAQAARRGLTSATRVSSCRCVRSVCRPRAYAQRPAPRTPDPTHTMRDSWRHFVAEFIGTFALVFIGGAAIMTTQMARVGERAAHRRGARTGSSSP